jgi:hypothetical protein
MGHISFVGKLDGEALKGGAPPLVPGFTLDLMARHSLDGGRFFVPVGAAAALRFPASLGAPFGPVVVATL